MDTFFLYNHMKLLYFFHGEFFNSKFQTIKLEFTNDVFNNDDDSEFTNYFNFILILN